LFPHVRTYRTKVEKSRQIFGIFRKIFFQSFPESRAEPNLFGLCRGEKLSERKPFLEPDMFLFHDPTEPHTSHSPSANRMERPPNTLPASRLRIGHRAGKKKRTLAGIRFGRSRTKSAAKVKARGKAPELVRRGGTTTAP
jgi:hypothetical protein